MTVLCQALVFNLSFIRELSFNEAASVDLCLIKWDLHGFSARTTKEMLIKLVRHVAVSCMVTYNDMIRKKECHLVMTSKTLFNIKGLVHPNYIKKRVCILFAQFYRYQSVTSTLIPSQRTEGAFVSNADFNYIIYMKLYCIHHLKSYANTLHLSPIPILQM